MFDTSPKDRDVVYTALDGVRAFYNKFHLKPTPEQVSYLILEQAPKIFDAGRELDDEDPASVAHYLKVMADHAFYIGGIVIAAEGRDPDAPLSDEEFQAGQVAHVIGIGRNMTIAIAGWEPSVYEKVVAEAFNRIVTANLTRSHDVAENLKVPKGDGYIEPDLSDLAKRLIASAE